VNARRGDVATVRLRAVRVSGEHVWSWSLRLTRGNEVVSTSQQSTLDSLPLSARALARREHAFVPERNEDAEAIRAVLEMADGSRTLEMIACELQTRCKGRFASAREAMDFVASHESLWK
jgi:hypothetical protein